MKCPVVSPSIYSGAPSPVRHELEKVIVFLLLVLGTSVAGIAIERLITRFSESGDQRDAVRPVVPRRSGDHPRSGRHRHEPEVERPVASAAPTGNRMSRMDTGRQEWLERGRRDPRDRIWETTGGLPRITERPQPTRREQAPRQPKVHQPVSHQPVQRQPVARQPVPRYPDQAGRDPAGPTVPTPRTALPRFDQAGRPARSQYDQWHRRR
ncbi:MAG TPA: hypothetical protein VHW44_22210 [Pseudonocardiaceae bacterium]|nr:hypothetical protein [Pseudonocardiaceae bacterium]